MTKQTKQSEWSEQWKLLQDDELFLFQDWIHPNTLYLLPLKFLPFYEYFQNFRKLSFYRNALNVFDKLNAPQVDFISYARAKNWVNDKRIADYNITPYKGVSWRVSARFKN